MSTIDDYDIGQKIGRGGFANVYRARNRKTGSVVAIKICERTSSSDPNLINRIKNEILIHSKLNHPNIVFMRGFFEDENCIYIVLDLCSGGTMFQYLQRNGPLSEDLAVKVIRPLIGALEYIHSHGVVHRDLKLSNILLTGSLQDPNTVVKICDFGLAVRKEHPDEEHFTLCGTPNYIAPEIASHRAHDYPADLWSIGCLFYSMVVGSPPFEQEDVKDTLERIITGIYHEPVHIMSKHGISFLRSLLELNPSKRASIRDLLAHPLLSPTTSSETWSHREGMCSSDSSRDRSELSPQQPTRRVEAESSDTVRMNVNNGSSYLYGDTAEMHFEKCVQQPESTAFLSVLSSDESQAPNDHDTRHNSSSRRILPEDIDHSEYDEDQSIACIERGYELKLAQSQQDLSLEYYRQEQSLQRQLHSLQTEFQRALLFNASAGPDASATTASTALVAYPGAQSAPWPIAQRQIDIGAKQAGTHLRTRTSAANGPPRTTSCVPTPTVVSSNTSPNTINQKSDVGHYASYTHRGGRSAELRRPTLSYSEPSRPQSHNGKPLPSSSVVVRGSHQDQAGVAPPPRNIALTAGESLSSARRHQTTSSNPDFRAPEQPTAPFASPNCADISNTSSINNLSASFLRGLSFEHNVSSDFLNRSSRSWYDSISEIRSSVSGSLGPNAAGSTPHGVNSPRSPARPPASQHTEVCESQENAAARRGSARPAVASAHREFTTQYAYEKFVGSPQRPLSASETHMVVDANQETPPGASDCLKAALGDMAALKPFCLTTKRRELLLLSTDKQLLFVLEVEKNVPNKDTVYRYFRLLLSPACPNSVILGQLSTSMQAEVDQIRVNIAPRDASSAKSHVTDDLNTSYAEEKRTSKLSESGIADLKYHHCYAASQLRVLTDLTGTAVVMVNSSDEGRQPAVHKIVITMLQRVHALIGSVKSRVPRQIVYFETSLAESGSLRASTCKDVSRTPLDTGPVASNNNKATVTCKCMLMSNDPFPDFYVQWNDGTKLRYELKSGRLHIQKPHRVFGSKSAKALEWTGFLDMHAPSSAERSGILPEFASYATVAQKALAKCLSEGSSGANFSGGGNLPVVCTL